MSIDKTHPIRVTDATRLREEKASDVAGSPTLEAASRLERCVVGEIPWFERNREAIDVYNLRILVRGVFSDGLRRF